MQTELVLKKSSLLMQTYTLRITRNQLDDEILSLAKSEQPYYKKGGFRKGHVPLNIIVSERISDKKFYNLAVEHVISKAVDKFLAHNKGNIHALNVVFSPLSTELESKICIFTYPHNWSFIQSHTLTKYESTIGLEEIESYAQKLMKSILCRTEASHDTVHEGDIITVVHQMHDQKFTNTVIATQNHWSIGKRINDIFDSFINESVLDDLESEQARTYFFSSKQSYVTAIYQNETLELNDTNAISIGYKNLEDLYEYAKQELELEVKMYTQMMLQKYAVDILIKESEGIELPEELFRDELNMIARVFMEYIHRISNGREFETVCKETFGLSITDIYINLQKFCHKKALVRYILLLWSSYQDGSFVHAKYQKYQHNFPSELETQSALEIMQSFQYNVCNLSYAELIKLISQQNREDSLSFLLGKQ